MRAKAKQAIVDLFLETGDESLLEAEFVVKANDMFHSIADKVNDKTGHLDSERILFEFREWLKGETRKRKEM